MIDEKRVFNFSKKQDSLFDICNVELQTVADQTLTSNFPFPFRW